jgi:hypothetical protein
MTYRDGETWQKIAREFEYPWSVGQPGNFNIDSTTSWVMVDPSLAGTQDQVGYSNQVVIRWKSVSTVRKPGGNGIGQLSRTNL